MSSLAPSALPTSRKALKMSRQKILERPGDVDHVVPFPITILSGLEHLVKLLHYFMFTRINQNSIENELEKFHRVLTNSLNGIIIIFKTIKD